MPKLLRAGATRTVSPHAIAGGRMAQAVLRPAVLDCIEEAIGQADPDLQMEEQLVRPGSPLDGKTVGTSGFRSRRGLILVAIKHRDGQLAFDPGDDDARRRRRHPHHAGPSGAQERADALALH